MKNQIIQGFRLSPQQRHIWLLRQGKDLLPYRVQCAVQIEGSLDKKILQAALDRLIRRHEILRTRFECLPEMDIPLQVISNNGRVSMESYDLSHLSPEEQFPKVEVIFRQSADLCFNFSQIPALHTSLIILSADRHVLLISSPALCADRESLRVLMSELIRCYSACLNDQEVPDDAVQYAELSEWQNELLETEDTQPGREYWSKQDLGSLISVKLPFEIETSRKKEFKPFIVTSTITPDLLVKIKTVLQRDEIPISTFLLTCLQVLIWRFTSAPDSLVGILHNCRIYEELQQAVGPFAKYLPLYIYLEENIRFDEFLRHVNESARDLPKWQDYFSWEQIKLPSRIEREDAFFPVAFDFDEQPMKYTASGLSFFIYREYNCIDRFKLKLNCVLKGNSIIAAFHYDSNLFFDSDIRRLAGQFRMLLESAATTPHSPIGKLAILNDSDYQQLLVKFNSTSAEYSKGTCIHQIFEQQVKSTPANIAVVFEEHKLTYQELNARANQLAHYLQTLQIGPDVLVAICLERSLEMVVSILGVLKAGCAYVPINPTLPKARLAFLLEDTNVSVLLTQKRIIQNLPNYNGRVVCLDEDWDRIAQQPCENLSSSVTSNNLVYVMYTSGSTGKPKGVAVEHQQLANYVNSILKILDLSTGSSYAAVSTFAADLGNTAIFPSLCTGSCLHVISEERATDPDALADYFHRHSIDCLKITPSHLQALLTSSCPEYILPRKRLVLGGEASTWDLVKKLHFINPNCLILNHYGPTESTVGTTTYQVNKDQRDDYSKTLPLGRPIDNARVYILDSQLMPVPLLAGGELYIGGEGVTRGYLNRPDLTAEKFVPDPFSDKSGSRLYKTGDLARYLPDGNIEFLGRIDQQVKIHGFRVELGEIESVLHQHPGVRETVVIAREDVPGERRLVAYLVPNKEFPSTTELRTYLGERLPDFMIPTAFFKLEHLPRMPNGKVDRNALSAPQNFTAELKTEFASPRTLSEKLLADIWANVLGIERVGIHDNFFELGGDSILSIQIIAKANQAGLRLTARQFFQHQTIAEQSELVATEPSTQPDQGPVTGPVPLTPIQRFFFDQDLSEPHHFNQSMLLEVRQSLDPSNLKKVVQKLLEHHDALRLRFVATESGWQQFNAGPDGSVPFSWIDLRTMANAEQEIAIEAAASKLQTSLSLSNGPLLNIVYFQLGNQKPDRLLIIIHHLSVDGISWRILLEDLQMAYMQLSSNNDIKFPAKTISFRQWAEHLTDYAKSDTLQQELGYWLSIRDTEPASLPVEGYGPNTVASVQTISVSLSAEETRALLQDVPQAYHTEINDVLLTALLQDFRTWTGSNTLLISLEGHGREEIEEDLDLSRTVGWFTSRFPVLLNIRETTHPAEALKTVKEQLRQIPNRGVGYGILRFLSPDREVSEKLRRLPQPDMSFNYLGQFDQVLNKSSFFRLAKESSGPTRSPLGIRAFLLELVGLIVEGHLQMHWHYSENLHQRATVERLALGFMNNLRSLIIHCQSPDTGGFTPSDFPRARLSQKDLDKLVSRISQPSEREHK